jgi:hypothetical protein
VVWLDPPPPQATVVKDKLKAKKIAVNLRTIVMNI